ncbi:tetratricopeptide repeat protein, partial [Porphyromonas loveana]|uniref:tetratricopeptide repeat protein n=1 Tax=Porphyromonas loveana TaxID=1884669 RepID=UPI0035A04DEE
MPKKFLRTIPLVLLGFLLFAFTSLSKDSDVHTADYYDVNVTRLFKEGNYAGGYKLLEEGLRAYPTATHLNKLMGRYYYQKKDYNNARFYLYRSVRADNANVEA